VTAPCVDCRRLCHGKLSIVWHWQECLRCAASCALYLTCLCPKGLLLSARYATSLLTACAHCDLDYDSRDKTQVCVFALGATDTQLVQRMFHAFKRCAHRHCAVQRLGIVPLLHQKLQQLHKLTSSHRLQQQILVASLGVLCPDWEPAEQCFPEVICNFFCIECLTASMPRDTTCLWYGGIAGL